MNTSSPEILSMFCAMQSQLSLLQVKDGNRTKLPVLELLDIWDCPGSLRGWIKFDKPVKPGTRLFLLFGDGYMFFRLNAVVSEMEDHDGRQRWSARVIKMRPDHTEAILQMAPPYRSQAHPPAG